LKKTSKQQPKKSPLNKNAFNEQETKTVVFFYEKTAGVSQLFA